MNETLVTMVGKVASGVSYKQTAAGVAVANFRMAATERRFDREAGDWVDGDTSWVTVVAWRWLATNVVSSLNKGDPVLVSGRLRVREWGEEGGRRSAVEIDARSVGHDLSRGTSAFRWAAKAKSGLVPGNSSESVAPVALLEEAVPEWIVEAVAAHRSAQSRPESTAQSKSRSGPQSGSRSGAEPRSEPTPEVASETASTSAPIPDSDSWPESVLVEGAAV